MIEMEKQEIKEDYIQLKHVCLKVYSLSKSHSQKEHIDEWVLPERFESVFDKKNFCLPEEIRYNTINKIIEVFKTHRNKIVDKKNKRMISIDTLVYGNDEYRMSWKQYIQWDEPQTLSRTMKIRPEYSI